MLSPLEQLVACCTSWHVLIACKCEDPAPSRPVSLCRVSPPHKVLLQDFRKELEASFKFPWPYRVPTAALPKNKPCAQGSSSWFIAQQSSMALLEEETVATKPIKEGLPSSHQPRAAELSAGLDGCRALARLQGRVRQRQLTGHFFPSRILAIFSQLFYATDIIRQ